jgi:hypothetical protein
MVDKLAGIGSQYPGSSQVYNWNLGLLGWGGESMVSRLAGWCLGLLGWGGESMVSRLAGWCLCFKYDDRLTTDAFVFQPIQI